MATLDELVSTFESIHAAGVDELLWPQALSRITRITGGAAATLEALEKKTLRHREFRGFNIPSAAELTYLSHYVKRNPRWLVLPHQKVGDFCWDYQFIDERRMNTEPFYAEFLAWHDMRYFISGVLVSSEEDYALVTVQRATRQGHVQQSDIELMERLVPHVRQAFEVSNRLKSAQQARGSMECALDALHDGVALIKADGAITYANTAFAAIARCADGISARKGSIDIGDAGARQRYAKVLAAVLRLRNGDVAPAPSEMLVPRRDGAPSYVLSVCPLVAKEREFPATAVAIVFIRDPTRSHATATHVLRERFGLTDTEAALAQALQAGQRLEDYARTRAVSIHTVYAHLRSIKDKTGCHRMGELIRKLNDLQVPLRLD